jgi:hypothetical protein
MNTTVVGTRYDALLNIGARQGVKQGMRFVVLRGRDLVGRASITSVDPDKSVAAVTDNFRGVKPEDRVRAIYQLPNRRGAESIRAEGAPTVRIAAYAAEVGGGPAPGTAVAQAAPAPEPTEPEIVVTEPPPPDQKKKSGTRALRMVGGALAILGIAALASRKGGTEAFSVQADPIVQAGQAAIRVRWSRPRQVSHEDVVQYQIIRYSGLPGDFDRVVGKVEGDRREFIDTQHDPIDLDGIFEGDAGTQEDLDETTISMVPGIAPGVSYRYTIETIFRPKVSFSEGDDAGGGGTDDAAGLEISQRSSFSNTVVPINAPGLLGPENGAAVDFTAVTLEGSPVAGATNYMFQVSTDPDVRQNVKTVARVNLPPTAPPGAVVSSGLLNLRQLFPNADQLFWRLGARAGAGAGNSGFAFGPSRLIVDAAAP